MHSLENRRIFASLTRGLLMAGLIFTLGVPGRAADTDTIRMTIFPTLGTLPILIAADKGYFAEQHLDVQLKKIPGLVQFVDTVTCPRRYRCRCGSGFPPVLLQPIFRRLWSEGLHPGWCAERWLER